MSSIIWLQDLSFLLTPNARVLCYRLCEKKLLPLENNSQRQGGIMIRQPNESGKGWLYHGFISGTYTHYARVHVQPHRPKIKILI